MTVMALRSGKNAGLHVPDDTFKKALAYIKVLLSLSDAGGFTYQPSGQPASLQHRRVGRRVLFPHRRLPWRRKSRRRRLPAVPNADALLLRPVLRRARGYRGRRQGPWVHQHARVTDWFLPEGADGSPEPIDTRREVGPVYRPAIACSVCCRRRSTTCRFSSGKTPASHVGAEEQIRFGGPPAAPCDASSRLKGASAIGEPHRRHSGVLGNTPDPDRHDLHDPQAGASFVNCPFDNSRSRRPSSASSSRPVDLKRNRSQLFDAKALTSFLLLRFPIDYEIAAP